ncbi:MAG: hypothetical protein R2762_05400 [Bryobacteraceae bacterium]
MKPGQVDLGTAPGPWLPPTPPARTSQLRRHLRRWLAPDLALAAAAITFLYALLLFDGPSKLFRDSDTGWHIRTGELILTTHRLPHADPYSFTKPGAPWFAWEWLSDVLMGAVHQGAGPAGVVLLYLCAIALCTWLWFRLTWILEGDFLLACLLASPMLSTVNLHWLARPHVLSWVFLLAWIGTLERAPVRFRIGHAAAIACVSTVWTNVHASFFLLPALALLYGVCFAATGQRPARWFFLAAAAGAAGSLCNPYGLQLHRHLAAYLSNGALLARIGEFQTFNFHSEGSLQILLTVALCAIGGTLALTQRRLHHFLLLYGFLFLALRSARALPVLALLLPFANRSIRDALAELPAVTPALRYSANLRRLELGFRGWFWAPLIVGVAFVVLQAPTVRARTGFPRDQFPVQAAARLDELVPAEARILAPDKFGGYLIYRFEGRRKVFFDGRSDFYGLDFLNSYIDMVQVRPGWERLVSSYRPTHALLPVNYSLVSVLPGLGWRELYRDSTAVLLAAPGSGISGGY